MPTPNLTKPMEKLMIRNVLKPFGSFRVALAIAVGLPVVTLSQAFGQAPPPATNPTQPSTQAGVAGQTTDANAGAGATGSGAGTSAEVERVVVTGSNIPTAEEV